MSFWAGWFCGGLSAVGVLWMLKKAKPLPEERIDLAARAVALDEQQRAARKRGDTNFNQINADFQHVVRLYQRRDALGPAASPVHWYPDVPPEWAHDIEPGDR